MTNLSKSISSKSLIINRLLPTSYNYNPPPEQDKQFTDFEYIRWDLEYSHGNTN